LDLYTLSLNSAIVLMCVIFVRHTFIRSRYFLQMFQQHGYKTREFRSWVVAHFSSKIVTAEHLLYNTIILILISFFSERITFLSGIIIMTVLTLFWFGTTGNYRSDREKKPFVLTARAKRLTATLLLFVLPLYYFFGGFIFSNDLFLLTQNIQEPVGQMLTADPYFLGFLLCLVDILIPFIIFPAALLLKPVEKSIQNGFKNQAREKIASLPHLKVIAITGSYGKTSTKFIIDAFLKERMNVCVTPGSYNTPMGICKVINNDLESQHQVLILEMGARYEGNIHELCEIAKPDISVITNVGISHLETFGSQEAVAREKSTLARVLQSGDTLILNGEDEIVKEMGSDRDDLKRILTGESHGQIWATDRSVDADGTRFIMRWQNGNEQSAEIKTRILGNHHIQNVLLAAAVAREFDIRIETVAIAASNMEPVEHRLELKKQGGLTIIDDAFNSNPVGARNAVDILASFETGRKIIITPGMIELGELEEEENRIWGNHIASSAIDLVILVGEEQTWPIHEGIDASGSPNKPEVRIAKTLFEANDILHEYARPGDIVLYENDLPDSYDE